MATAPTLLERGLNLYLEPENRLSIPCIFLGNALPSLFQSLAKGTYIDITFRAGLYAFNQSPIKAFAIQQTRPLGDWIQAHAQKQINEVFQLNQLSENEQVFIKNILGLVGLDPKDPLSDKAIVQTAAKVAILAGTLFAISTLTGTGIFPLFWAYQRIGLTCTVINFCINIYNNPEDYPLTMTAINKVHAYIQQQADQ